MSDREHRPPGAAGAAGEQESITHAHRGMSAQELLARFRDGDMAAGMTLKHAINRRRARKAAEAQTTVGGERGEAHAQQDAAVDHVSMDPSVKALFDGTRSTDQEQGTGDRDIAEQASHMRTAMHKHFSDFMIGVELGTKIALAGTAGMGKAKTHKTAAEKFGALAKLGVQLAWKYCGGAAQVKEVLGIAKELLLGDMEKYADKAYEFAKGQIEKHGTEAHLEEVTQHLSKAVTLNAAEFAEKGRAQIGSMPAALLAQSWRIISGTRDNMTVKGEKLDNDKKETVAMEMIETSTGIMVGPVFGEKLAMLLRQQALVTYADLMTNPADRKAALETVLSGGVPEEVQRIAEETGDAELIRQDKARRAAVHE